MIKKEYVNLLSARDGLRQYVAILPQSDPSAFHGKHGRELTHQTRKRRSRANVSGLPHRTFKTHEPSKAIQ